MITLTRTHKLLLIIPILCACYCIVYVAWAHPPLDIIWVGMQNYNDRGEHQKMVEEYGKLVEKYPDEARLLYPLAWGLYKTGRYSESAEVVEEYVERNPFYPPWKQRYINAIRKKAFDDISGHNP